MGCHFLLQGIFLTQGSNLSLLQWQADSLPLSHLEVLNTSSVQFSSATQSFPTLCDPMNCSTPGLPVHHQLLEFTQTHVHRVGDAIQPSHPLSSPSPPAPNPSPVSSSQKEVSEPQTEALGLGCFNPAPNKEQALLPPQGNQLSTPCPSPQLHTRG